LTIALVAQLQFMAMAVPIEPDVIVYKITLHFLAGQFLPSLQFPLHGGHFFLFTGFSGFGCFDVLTIYHPIFSLL
jgi:hypothetical protein